MALRQRSVGVATVCRRHRRRRHRLRRHPRALAAGAAAGAATLAGPATLAGADRVPQLGRYRRAGRQSTTTQVMVRAQTTSLQTRTTRIEGLLEL